MEMEAAFGSLEALLRYQETLFLFLIAVLTMAACLMTFVCLALLWFEGPLARQRPASLAAGPTGIKGEPRKPAE